MNSRNLHEVIFSLWQGMHKCEAVETWVALTTIKNTEEVKSIGTCGSEGTQVSSVRAKKEWLSCGA